MTEHLDDALARRVLGDDLTPDERAAVDRHLLAGCPVCEMLLECLAANATGPGQNVTASFNGRRRATVQPPTVAGYELREPLGHGGMGVVYRARDLKLNRDVALKTLREGEFASPRDLERLREEARHVARLEHPHIVPLYEVGGGPGFAFFTMKLVESGTLARRLGDFRTPAAVARVVQKIARAIHYAHQRGLIHCDLKPHNVLLDSAGEPLVSDFGLARHLNGPAAVSQRVAGTPAYMAPEQARGESGLTTAVDVYALGCILYELLTSQAPYRGATALEVIRQVIECEPLRPSAVAPGVDPDLEAVCLKCLERRPEDRYGGADEVADELGRYLRGEGVLARPPGMWDWLQRALRRQPDAQIAYRYRSIFVMAAIIGLTHLAVFALTAAGASTPSLWLAFACEAVGCGFVWWYFQALRFRELSPTERIASVTGLGHMIADAILFFTHAPLRAADPITGIYDYYPPLTVTTGLAFFVVGSYHWGRFYYLGLLFMLQAFAYRLYPPLSPLLLAVSSALALGLWAHALRSMRRGEPGVTDRRIDG